jgi:general secretion pathway protein M
MSTVTEPRWIPASPRDRRVLAIVILLLLMTTVVACVAVPSVLLHRYYDQYLSRLSRQLNSQSAFNNLRPKVAIALEALKSRDVRRLYLRGATAALASAELQDLVKQAVEANGGRIIANTSVSPKDEGQYRLVTANFQINVSNANLRRVLHALETREPYLFSEMLVIRSQVPFGFRPQSGIPEPDLFVQMDVSGIARVASDTVSRPAQGGKS